MSTQLPIGGERLGSGKKMNVEIHGFGKSNHDLGHIVRTTMAAGTLVPFLKLIALPGDEFDMDFDLDIKTNPTTGPLFGSYKAQIDVFIAPMRLYNGKLHNNQVNIGLNMQNILMPLIQVSAATLPDLPDGADIDNTQINPSALLSYLGIRGVGFVAEPQDRTFQALYLLAYWEIVKQYYSNKQEEIGAMLDTVIENTINTINEITVNGLELPQAPSLGTVWITNGMEIVISFTGAEPDLSQVIVTATSGRRYTLAQLLPDYIVAGSTLSGIYNSSVYGSVVGMYWQYQQPTDTVTTQPTITTFPLSNIDDMRKAILAHAINDTAFDVTAQDKLPYNRCVWNLAYTTEPNFMRSSQQGLALKTYQSDLFNNWISTEWIDGVGGINDLTSIDTSGGSFTVDTLLLAKKTFDMLNRIAVSGGTYDDWIDVQWMSKRHTRTESPAYVGGLIKELIFQEVVSNAEAENQQGTQPLGTLAGKGVMSNKHKGGRVNIKVDEPSVIIGIISLTPRIDYSQGNDWDTHLESMADLHVPSMDAIGFQDLIEEQMAWWSTYYSGGQWVQQSAGKQPAWVNYMTAVNKTFGNFAIRDNQMWMTLNRRYESAANSGVPDRRDIGDLTTYIDPSKYNNIFAQTALDSQNFWVQIATDIDARRVMSQKVMPNL